MTCYSTSRSIWINSIVWAAAIAIAMVLAWTGISVAGLINTDAPAFTLNDLGGKERSLSDFKGKVVFIDFWASWCGPCKKEMPELAKLVKKFPNDLVLLAINEDKVRSHAESFVSGLPGLSSNFIVLLDADSKVIPKYSAATMPTSFIVDKKGVIRHVHFGFREEDPDAWVEEIGKLVKE